MAKVVLLEKFNSKKLGWLHDSIFFIVAVLVAFIVFKYVIGISYVSGDSMESGLHNGEGLLYLRIAARYEPGDVVSIWVPSGDYYIKRVVAVGGDTVDLQDGKIYVNGKLLENDHGMGQTLKEEGAVIYPYVVREGNLFVLGDNREVSVDSRSFGEVNLLQVRGKILFKFGQWYVKAID